MLYFYKAAVDKDIEALIDRYETNGLTSEAIEQLFHRSLVPSDTPDGTKLKAEQQNRKEVKKGDKSSKKSAFNEALALNAIKKFKNKLSEYYDAIGVVHMVSNHNMS